MPKKKKPKTIQKNTFPLLNTEEAEVIVHELGRALDAHRDWIRSFRTMLVCHTEPDDSDLNAGARMKTPFAIWYYGDVNPNLRDHPDFTAVGKEHVRMHAVAHNLAIKIRDGDAITPVEYRKFLKSVDKFRQRVRLLLSEAWEYLRYADPLTGVMTRTAMQSRLEAEQELARRNDSPCSIGMMDLDHFKNVNDTYGHQAGDDVLKTIAGYVKTHLRRYDQVFRYGGEEFVLVLPNSTTANTKRVLDRLRRGIKRQKIKIGKNKTLSVSASFGVAELLPTGPVKESIAFADKALYEAKHAGRNRVCVWQPGKS